MLDTGTARVLAAVEAGGSAQGSAPFSLRHEVHTFRSVSRTAAQQSVPKLVWTVGINVLAVVAILFTLYQTRQIVAWMLIALLFSLALDPAVEFLQARGFHRGLAIATIFLGMAGVLALLSWIL